MIGVLNTVLELIEEDGIYVGVATDHVIESFRNALWAEYKTGDGIEPALLAQFHPLEEALAAIGVAVWPMIELEADDALASAAQLAAQRCAYKRFAFGRPTRISHNACGTSASCKSIGRARRFGTQPVCARNSV